MSTSPSQAAVPPSSRAFATSIGNANPRGLHGVCARRSLISISQEEWRKDPGIIAKVAELQLPTAGSIKFVPKVVKKGGELQIDRGAATAAQGNAKGKSGPIDAEGRIWIRNYAHAGYPDHWDVQIDLGADYMNVTLQGELMPRIDKNKNKAEGVAAPRPGGGFGGKKP